MRNRTQLLLVLAMIVLLPLANRAAAQPTQPAPPSGELTPAPTGGEGDEGQEAQAGADDEKTEQPAGDKKEDLPPNKSRNFWEANKIFIIMIGAIILLYVWMGRSRRKKEAQRKEMLSNLKKGDKVTSIGGIIGTVIEVKEDEVTVKVDETNNVRMKFVRRAIQGVGDEGRSQADQQK